MSITTASTVSRPASSTASRPSRARPTTANRPSASSSDSSAMLKSSSSSATRMRYAARPPRSSHRTEDLACRGFIRFRKVPALPGDDPVARRCHRTRGRLLRDLDVEGRSGAAVGFDPDAALDAAHELAADVEAEAGAADAAAHVGVEAVELLEDPPLLARGDPEAGVRDREADVAFARLERDVDRAAVGRVLDGVLDQVRDHLPELPRVRRDGR